MAVQWLLFSLDSDVRSKTKSVMGLGVHSCRTFVVIDHAAR